jgi:predicted transcriptional regulator
MKSNGLLGLIIYSNIRTEIILLLLCKPMTLSELKNYFNISSPEIIPRLKELQNNEIIFKENNEYILSDIGKIIAMNLKPFLNTLDTINQNKKFLKEHNLGSLPTNMLMKLHYLQDCTIIEEKLDNIQYVHEKVFNHIFASNSINCITSIFDQQYPTIFLELSRMNKKLSIILTEPIFNKFKKDYQYELQLLLSNNNLEVYILKEDIKIFFIVTDIYIALFLPYKQNYFDIHSNLMSFNQSSIDWGEELFKYYKIKSERYYI